MHVASPSQFFVLLRGTICP